MSDPEPFGRKACDLPGYEDCWVEFRTAGYPRKLRREWDAAVTADAVWGIVARYVVAWHVTDLDGQAVSPSADIGILDNVEDMVVTWLIRAFSTFWLTEATVPRPNLSRPLVTTPTA